MLTCMLLTGEVAPLECNLDALNGISYSKGCYIGQERNSYTHYRGIIRKRMMPVMLPGLDQQSRELHMSCAHQLCPLRTVCCHSNYSM